MIIGSLKMKIDNICHIVLFMEVYGG